MTADELLRRYAAGERDFRGVSLRDADLTDADLRDAILSGASLRGADLSWADLRGVSLRDADLTDADLRGADLCGADLRADLNGVYLRGAYLRGVILPDGRVWEVYRADHLAGLCTSPDVRARAIAAWGDHDWQSCPMHAAFGVYESTGTEMSAWVALYDAGLLPKPEAA